MYLEDLIDLESVYVEGTEFAGHNATVRLEVGAQSTLLEQVQVYGRAEQARTSQYLTAFLLPVGFVYVLVTRGLVAALVMFVFALVVLKEVARLCLRLVGRVSTRSVLEVVQGQHTYRITSPDVARLQALRHLLFWGQPATPVAPPPSSGPTLGQHTAPSRPTPPVPGPEARATLAPERPQTAPRPLPERLDHKVPLEPPPAGPSSDAVLTPRPTLPQPSAPPPPAVLKPAPRHIEPPSRSTESPGRPEIRRFARERGVDTLLHFTRLENLPGILEHGLRPRQEMDVSPAGYIANDSWRGDGRRHANCLSISWPNYKMFFKYRQVPDTQWVVLTLDPAVLWELDCGFTPINAASKAMHGRTDDELRTLESFQAMFGDEESRSRLGLALEYPTNPQAEVLVFGIVPSRYITTVHFEGYADPSTAQLVQQTGLRVVPLSRYFKYRPQGTAAAARAFDDVF